MAAIRRHWKLVITNILLICVGLGIFAWYVSRPASPAAAVQAPPSSSLPPPLDSVTYSRINLLRQKLCLADMDLSTMGCSQSQTATILSNLLAWYQTNAGNWNQAEQNQQTATGSLQEAWRQVNVGPKNATLISQLPSYQQAADATTQQTNQFINSAAASVVLPQLNTAQSTVWSIAQANVNAPGRYRYVPNLTATQAQQLKQAIYLNANNPSALASAEQLILSGAQQQAMASAPTTASQNSGNVAAGEQSVIVPPLPTTPIISQ